MLDEWKDGCKISAEESDGCGRGLIIDNGCNVKPLNILNLASRMEDVKICYKMDLFFKL